MNTIYCRNTIRIKHKIYSYLAAVAGLAITGLTNADLWLGVLLINCTAAKPVRAQLSLTAAEVLL